MQKHVFFLGLVLSVLLLAGCATQTQSSDTQPTPTAIAVVTETPTELPTVTPVATPTTYAGRVVFGIADKAVSLGSVTGISITVDSVEAHMSGGNWTAVSSKQMIFDLLQLKAQGTPQLLADVNLTPGTYEQLRLIVSKVVVVDASGSHDAKLPSGELKLVGQLNVAANSTSAVTFDFVADESLHETGNGEYVLAPVIRLETREGADVNISEDGKLEVRRGKPRLTKMGMDENGNVGEGLSIAADAQLDIENGKVKARPRPTPTPAPVPAATTPTPTPEVSGGY